MPAPLSATESSRVVAMRGRTTFQGKVPVAAGAKKLSAYVHVKAFLVADTHGAEMVDRRYAEGARILLAERWDNLDGVAGRNYAFDIAAPQN